MVLGTEVRSGGMRAKLYGAHSDVLLMTLTGVHTAASLQRARKEVNPALAQCARVFVADYSGAMLLFDLDVPLALSGGGEAPRMPGAFVVNAVQLPQIVRYANAQCMTGRVRRVFSDADSELALVWAVHQADLRR